jgi:catechol 2,3-dioxygenase-like lactoylglutathione lyase family enzyme
MSAAAEAPGSPRRRLAHVAFVVRDYDEAIAFFVDILQFSVVEDTYQPEQDKRWVLVAPPCDAATSLLLARAITPEQVAVVGKQAAGRVFLFLSTDDFWRDYHRMRDLGVRFVREPTQQAYGMVAVFEDLYGNRWDLLQYTSDAA